MDANTSRGSPAETLRINGRLELPQTLHGQLFLLACDRRRRRVDGDDRWRFGLALRSAMLTDLYLTGHLGDEDGTPCPLGGSRPDDPLLCAAIDEIGADHPQSWMHAAAHDRRRMSSLVRSQLEAAGWILVQPRRLLGVVPTTRLRLHDEGLVDGLSDEVGTALHAAIDGLPADERLLSVGLLGALGQLPTVFGFEEASRHHERLEDLVDHAIPPIVGMREVIEAVNTAIRANDTGPYIT